MQPQPQAQEHPRPLTDAQLARYHADGYVEAGPILDETELVVLRRELDRVIADQHQPEVPQPVSIRNLGGDQTPVWQIVNIWCASPAFAALLRHPRLSAILAQVAGNADLRLWHDQIQYKPAGTGGTNWWHQDAPYWAPLSPQHSLFTAWIALDDAHLDNGCMSMVPGSHRWGDTQVHLHACREAEPDFWRSLGESFQGQAVHVVPRPVRAGHVHLHHALTWHGSHANASGRPRRAIAIHVMTPDTVFNGSPHHCMARWITERKGERIVNAAFPPIGR